jgi:riboflavin transporter FmnP
MDIIGLLLISFSAIANLLLYFIFDYIADILVSKRKIKKNRMGNIYIIRSGVFRYVFKLPIFLKKLNEVINETDDTQKREQYLKLRKRTVNLIIFAIMMFVIFVFYVIYQCLLHTY